jgi:hypothetical protein
MTHKGNECRAWTSKDAEAWSSVLRGVARPWRRGISALYDCSGRQCHVRVTPDRGMRRLRGAESEHLGIPLLDGVAGINDE